MDKSDTKAAVSNPAEKKPSGATDSTTSSSKGDSAKPDATPSTSDGDSAKPKKNPPRPASFFSSVRSDEYRSGWDSVFGKAKPPSHQRKRATTLELSAADLTEAERAVLLAAAKRKMQGRRVNLDRAAGKGELSWSIVCRIGRGDAD